MKKSFISIYIIITLIGFLVVLKNPHETSSYENRTLNQFSHITLNSFLDKTFQKNFEASYKDQFWLNEKIKIKNNSLKTIFTNREINKNICKNNYVKIAGEFYTYNCDDYLVEKYKDYNAYSDVIENKIDSYKKIEDYAELYYYFVNKSANFNFITNEKTFDITNYLTNNYAELEFKNYDEYKEYYYKTDHHWNYKGSYQGYKDIINLLFDKNEKMIDIKNKKTFDVNFYGSSARTTTFTKYKENLTVYTFDIPEHEELVNGKKVSYGNEKKYLDNNFDRYMWKNHYGEYYGGDPAEVIFDFKNNEKENLLILSNSYSNSINKLIASHFNKTYVIDLRHYNAVFGEDFNYKNYIKDNDIDKVLVICDITYLLSDMFDLKEVEQDVIY